MKMKRSKEMENHQGIRYDHHGNCCIQLWGKLYRYRGLISAFIVSCFSCGVTMLVTILQGAADVSQIVFARGSVSFMISLVLLLRLGVKLTPTSREEIKGLLFQGIANSVVIWTMYYAYQNMPTGDATAIVYGYIAFSVVLGRIFLREPLGWFEGIMVIITIVGVVLIVRPSFLFRSQDTMKLLPALSALCASLCSAFFTIAFRYLGKQNTNPIKSVFYTGIFNMALSSALITITQDWHIPGCTEARLQIVCFSVLSYCNLILFAYALAIENIALVTVITVSEVYLVFFADTFLLGTAPNLLSIAGMLMIIGSSLGISGKKIMQIRKQLNKEKNDALNDSDAIREDNVEDDNCVELNESKWDLHTPHESTV